MISNIDDSLKAEQELDAIYHALPEWVNRQFPNVSLSKKIKMGFEYQEKNWIDAYLKESDRLKDASDFSNYLVNKYKVDFLTEYFRFSELKNKK